MIDSTQITTLRLNNQELISSGCTSVKEVVGRMGAMQAQDAAMVKWAIGIRLAGSTNQLVEQAIADGEILRTHLMRPTWHYVTPEDIQWLLKLTASQIKTLLKSRDKVLELTEQIYTQSNNIIEKALAEHGHLTRDEILPALHTAGIPTDMNRASHLFMRAELEGIICSGKPKTHKQTYALLSERAPHQVNLNHDEAVVELAQRYFRSHGPATLNDFAWWSGLSLKDVRMAMYMLQPFLISEKIENKVYWFAPDVTSKPANDSVHALPAYDEFLISYRDRTASLPPEINAKAVSNNGIFRPVILVNGKVIGIWKRTIKGKLIQFETEFFQPISTELKQNIYDALDNYLKFSNQLPISSK